MDGPRKSKGINPGFEENNIYDLPCGKTFDGNDLEPIHVDKFVGLSEYKGRSIVTLVVSKISFLLLFCSKQYNLVTHCCHSITSFTIVVNHFQTPSIKGNAHYCAVAKSNHLMCSNAMTDEGNLRWNSFLNGDDVPTFCLPMSSRWSLLIKKNKNLPFIASYIPFCTSHFRCGWLYILVIGSVAFVTSCLLAVCFVHCCCR